MVDRGILLEFFHDADAAVCLHNGERDVGKLKNIFSAQRFQQIVHCKAQVEQCRLVDNAVADKHARAAGYKPRRAPGAHAERGDKNFRRDDDKDRQHAAQQRELGRFDGDRR